VYDGTPRTVTAASTSGNPVFLTYDGSTNAPINAGIYSVTGTVASTDTYLATTGTATLVVAKANQAVDFPNIGDQVTTNTVALSATASSGLTNINFGVVSGPALLDGSTVSFTNSGAVVLSAQQPGNINWNASPVTNISLNVPKAVASVSLSDTNQTYNGSARAVTASTVPTGLNVNLTYDGSSIAPTNAGEYTIIAAVDEAMYQGGTTGILTVAKAYQTVTFPNIGDQISTRIVDLSATASSGLTNINFSVVSGPALLDGNTVSFTNGGTVVLSAQQPGDGNWNPSPLTNISFSVFLDSDDDGISDQWESLYFDSPTGAVSTADTDGDGADNLTEYISGHNPTNSDSVFEVTTFAPPTTNSSDVIITWDSVTGRIYNVDWNDDLQYGSFTNISGDLPYPANSYTDRVEQTGNQNFYRLDVRLGQ